MGKIEQNIIKDMNAAELDAAYRSHLRGSIDVLPNMNLHKLQIARAERLLIAFNARPLAEKMDVIRARRNRV